MASSFEDLIAWQKAMRLAREVYRATAGFPREETFGLKAQLRRAAVSVPSNVAEGQGRLTPRDFRHFLGTARGSLMEVRTQLLLARDFHYLDSSDAEQILQLWSEVAQLINALQKSIKVRAEEEESAEF